MKTTIEVNGFEIVIEETEGNISVSALKDGESVEEFSLETDAEGSEGSEDSENDSIKGFDDFDEESDIVEDDMEEDLEETEEDMEEAEEDMEEAEEDLEEAEEDLEESEEDSKLESFQSFINKRK